MKRLILPLIGLAVLSACIPTEIRLQNAATRSSDIRFYPGATRVPDLLIIDGVNYFGTAQYQLNDPLGDIGFRFESGERVQAECVEHGTDIIGQPQCNRYEVYRSSFALIPVGTVANRPSPF